MSARGREPVVRISSSQREVRLPRKRIAELVAFTAAREAASVAEVDVGVVGRAEIAELNRRYLGRRGVTDVLSFDLSGGAGPLAAQIVVCGPVAAAEARVRGGGVQRELLLYVLHGLLHVLGYDDRTPADAERMHAREDELLEQFAAKRG